MSDKGTQADYVMFGHSGLFSDYVDIIGASGGHLKKVVANIPDVRRPGDGRTFAEDLEAMNRWLRERPDGRQIELQHIDSFAPAPGESYVIGFRGTQIGALLDRLKRSFGLAFLPLRHPSAAISATAEVGEGAIVGAGSVVGSFAQLGQFCLINRGVTLGHHVRIEAFANIAPGVDIASGVTVGQGAAIGIGATIVNGLSIGAGAFVTAGTVVTRDVEPDSRVAGVPARRVRQQ
jgi:sugar O-acyltransferase (sialic acid O-acetyltransferase NeuD family)